MREGWRINKLKDVCIIGDGNYSSKYPKASEFTLSGIPFITATNLKCGTILPEGIRFISERQHSELTKGHVKENDLVVVVRGSSTGNSSLVPKEYENSNLNSQLAFLRADKSIIKSKYLYYVFNSPQVQDVLIKTISGSAQPQLPNNKLLGIEIPIPPLEEQQEIVALLDQAFEAIDQAKANMEKNIANAKELFQSKLNDIFSQKGEGWVEKKLGEIGTLTSSKRIYKNEYVLEGTPFYRSKEIKELANKRDVTTELFISSERYNEIKNKFGVPQQGDILLTAVGTIGEMYVVKKDEPDFYFKDGNIMWLKDFSSLNTYYLRYALICFVEQLKALSKGSAYNALTIEKLKEYSVPIPSLLEQEEIVKQLDALLDLQRLIENNYNQKLKYIDQLKKSLLQKAFAGELTNKTLAL